MSTIIPAFVSLAEAVRISGKSLGLEDNPCPPSLTWSQQQHLHCIVVLPPIFSVFNIIHTEGELNVEHQSEASFSTDWFCIVWIGTQLKIVPVCGFVTTELPPFLENLRSPYTFFNECKHSECPCSAGDQFPLWEFQMSHQIIYKMWMKLTFRNKNQWGKAGSVIRNTSLLQDTGVKNVDELLWYSGVYTYEGRMYSCPAVVCRSFYCESHLHVLGILVICDLYSNDIAATSRLSQHRAFWGRSGWCGASGWFGSLSLWKQLDGVWSLQDMHLCSW